MDTKFLRFEVEGMGEFPIDMLRHDRAWPFTSSDAVKVMLYGRRRVELLTYDSRALTPARWESFGWKVISQKESS